LLPPESSPAATVSQTVGISVGTLERWRAEVHDTDSADHAAHLARRIALAEGVHAMPVKPVLHGDNGATLKGTTVLAMLYWLGIEPSYSRLIMSRPSSPAAPVTAPSHSQTHRR
jgi:hypothetical protein